jgi:MoxR-like ATPase
MPATESWYVYAGMGKPQEGEINLPAPPSWRTFAGGPVVAWQFEEDPHSPRRLGDRGRGETYQASPEEVDLVNAALYLRRPLLVTGGPGVGKSSLAYSVASELKLGPVLRWNITSRATLRDGLYQYDAIGRLQDASLSKEAPDIGQYLRLGPLGTALLPSQKPRVLLIDEIDKSDIDLPNDLLNVFEEGEFLIPELFRLRQERREVAVLPADSSHLVKIVEGRIRCHEFPFVVLTSNAEREFSPPFLRRCVRLQIQKPDRVKLAMILEAHMPLGDALSPTQQESAQSQRIDLIQQFLARQNEGELATDQLMNAVFMISGDLVGGGTEAPSERKKTLISRLLAPLSRSDEES